MKLMKHSDVRGLDEDERRIYGQAIAEAGLAGAHAVQRMLDADPAWAKFVWDGNPRFHRDVWLEYGRIFSLGLRLAPDPDGQWGDGIVELDHERLCLVEIGDQPRLFTRIPLNEAARRARELADGLLAIDGAEAVVDWPRGHVDVEAPLVGADHGSVAGALRTLRTEILRPDEPEPAPCSGVLRAAGIGVPDSLGRLLDKAQQLDDWYWSSDAQLTSPGAEYLMEDRDWLLQPMSDQVVVSHWGHGGNSYALTVRLAVGRIALHAQVGYGGGFMGVDAGACAVTRLLHECAAMVDDAASWDESPRGRDLVVRWSQLGNQGSVKTWNPDLRRWDDVSIGGESPLSVARGMLLRS